MKLPQQHQTTTPVKLNYSRNPELLLIYSSKMLHRITARKEYVDLQKTNDGGKNWIMATSSQHSINS